MLKHVTLVTFSFGVLLLTLIGCASNNRAHTNETVVQDGKFIYFSTEANSSGRDIIRLNINNGVETNLTKFTGSGHYPHHNSPKISPDGKQIVYQSDSDGHDRYSIWTMNIDGSDKKRLIQKEGLYPNWSPDSKSIIFSGRRKGTWEILIISSLGGKEVNISKNLSNSRKPGWGATCSYHPDGKMIVYSYVREKVLYSMYLETGKTTKLTADGASFMHPVFSPDGSKLAVNRKADKSYDLVTMSFQNKQFSIIEKNIISYSYPSWSKTGKEILFVKMPSGNQEIFKINVETKEKSQITKNQDFDAMPTWQ